MESFGFHPLVGRWFHGAFREPTPPQRAGWKHIGAGEDTLIAAPTGSGKTLAAFMSALNDLVEQTTRDALDEGTQVIYVSPLKALGNDIDKNLRRPLAEMQALAGEDGSRLGHIRVGLRTGDTPARERRLQLKRPPHILITTPESLYILLTAEGSRTILSSARGVIVDEIHAIAEDKRGAHLALSLERLDHLAGRPRQSPEVPPGGQRAHEDASIEHVAVHADAVPEDGAPGEG